MTTHHKITTIVLTWNSVDFIERCLTSLQKSNLKTNITVVDNNSSDTTRELVHEKFPLITVLNTGDNLGYAGGNNVAIKQAIKEGSEYVFVINPDAYIDKDCIAQLLHRFQHEPNLGAASPKIYFNDSHKLWFAGSEINWRTGVATQFGGDDIGQFDDQEYTERINGCAMMIPTRVLQDVGLMDESYFLYYEEVDWSVMCHRKNYRLGLVKDAKAYHQNSSSTGGHLSPLYQYYMTRNKLYFMKKFKPTALPIVSLVLLRNNLESVYVAYRDVNFKQARLLIKAFWRAYSDFILGRFGRRSIPR